MASRSRCTPVRKMGEEERRREGGLGRVVCMLGFAGLPSGVFLFCGWVCARGEWLRIFWGLFNKGCEWALEMMFFYEVLKMNDLGSRSLRLMQVREPSQKGRFTISLCIENRFKEFLSMITVAAIQRSFCF